MQYESLEKKSGNKCIAIGCKSIDILNSVFISELLGDEISPKFS